MKQLLILFTTLSTCFGSFANSIDTLNSASDINQFLHSTFYDNTFEVVEFDTSFFYFKDQYKACDSLGFSSFHFKTDVDKNGMTDLILSLYDTLYNDSPKLVVIFASNNKNGNGYKMETIKSDYYKRFYPMLVKSGNRDLLLTYKVDGGYSKQPTIEIEIDTLTYYENHFITYSNSPSKHRITRIEFETTRCYGRCPAFKLSIDKKNMQLEGISFTKEKGFFSSPTDSKVFKRVNHMLNQSNFTSFNDEYWKNISDSPTYFLRIWYGKNEYKEIKDYPGEGNQTLKEIYNLLFLTKYTSEWK